MESAESAAAHEPAPLECCFGVDDLPQLRQLAAQWATDAGLLPLQTVDFVLAVHEIATNAVLHGSPAAQLRLRVTSDGMAEAEIRDSGQWTLTEPPTGMGMGLHVARQVCTHVTIQAGSSGSVVALRMALTRRAGGS